MRSSPTVYRASFRFLWTDKPAFDTRAFAFSLPLFRSGRIGNVLHIMHIVEVSSHACVHASLQYQRSHG